MGAFLVDGDKQEYFCYHHPKGLIVCAQQDEAGMTAAAALTMKMMIDEYL